MTAGGVRSGLAVTWIALAFGWVALPGLGCGSAEPAVDSARKADAAGASPAREKAGSDAGPDTIGENGIRDGGSPVDARVADDGPHEAGKHADADADAYADGGAGPGEDPSDMRCNGHAALCDRRFDEVVFPATHNAMASADDGFFAPNQPHGLGRQLTDGIRALLLDTHPHQGESYLCHTACELGRRRLVDGLREIADFLRDHPHEVVSLLIEDRISAAQTDRAFEQSGLRPYTYVHQGRAPWPTLRTMIARNQRLLVTAENGRPPPAYYHHLWDLAWDTPYSFPNRAAFSCRLNRGQMDNRLFLLNHWVENPLPNPLLSRDVNRRQVLLARARQCEAESGKRPNFVAVNHYTLGDLLAVVRELNGL